jgi:hypothetical protein
MFIFYARTIIVIEYEIRRRKSREINTKVFLVTPLRQTHVLCDDIVFLIIVIVNVTTMATTKRSHC